MPLFGSPIGLRSPHPFWLFHRIHIPQIGACLGSVLSYLSVCSQCHRPSHALIMSSLSIVVMFLLANGCREQVPLAQAKPRGCTTHSTFKVSLFLPALCDPLLTNFKISVADNNEMISSSIRANDSRAPLIQNASIVTWDEASDE